MHHATQDVQIAQPLMEHKYALDAQINMDFLMELVHLVLVGKHQLEELPNVQHAIQDAQIVQPLMERKYVLYV